MSPPPDARPAARLSEGSAGRSAPSGQGRVRGAAAALNPAAVTVTQARRGRGEPRRSGTSCAEKTRGRRFCYVLAGGGGPGDGTAQAPLGRGQLLLPEVPRATRGAEQSDRSLPWAGRPPRAAIAASPGHRGEAEQSLQRSVGPGRRRL